MRDAQLSGLKLGAADNRAAKCVTPYPAFDNVGGNHDHDPSPHSRRVVTLAPCLPRCRPARDSSRLSISSAIRFVSSTQCARRYGDWFTVRVPGVSPFVFTSDPAAVREVFLGDADALHAGEANRPLGAFMGERSSLFLDGARASAPAPAAAAGVSWRADGLARRCDALGGRSSNRVVADRTAVPDSPADALDHFRNDHPHSFRI